MKWHPLIKWKKRKNNDAHHWEYYCRMKYASDLIKAFDLTEQIVLNHCNVGFLDEHKALGLFDFGRFDQYRVDGRIKDYIRCEMDDLLNWINMMTRDVKNGSAIYLEAYTLENRFCPRRIGLHVSL